MPEGGPCAPINPDPTTYALAYEHGQAAVAEQADALNKARDRANTLTTTAAAVATLATGLAFRTRSINLEWWGVVGLFAASAGFVAVCAVAVSVWRPVTITRNLNAGVLVTSFVERPGAPMTLVEMHIELALWYGRFTVDNANAIENRLRWFSWGLIGLAVETGGLTTMLLSVAIT